MRPRVRECCASLRRVGQQFRRGRADENVLVLQGRAENIGQIIRLVLRVSAQEIGTGLYVFFLLLRSILGERLCRSTYYLRRFLFHLFRLIGGWLDCGKLARDLPQACCTAASLKAASTNPGC